MTQLQTATTHAIHGGDTPQASSGGAVTSRVSVASAEHPDEEGCLEPDQEPGQKREGLLEELPVRGSNKGLRAGGDHRFAVGLKGRPH